MVRGNPGNLIRQLQSAVGPSLSFVTSNSVQNNNTLVISSSAQTGDLMIFLDWLQHANGATNTIPAGFNQIVSNWCMSSIRVAVSFKVLEAADPGRNLSDGLNAPTPTSFKLAAYWRPSFAITGWSVGSFFNTASTICTASKPADAVLALATLGLVAPVMAVAAWGSTLNITAANRAQTPNDQYVSFASPSGAWLGMKLYNPGDTLATVTATMNDIGSHNHMQHNWLKLV